MDKNEIFEKICSLRSKHGISLGEIKEIQRKEKEKLSSITKIFDMSTQDDVNLLLALIYLLNKEPYDLYEWFKNNHKDYKYLRKSKNISSVGIVAAINSTTFPTILNKSTINENEFNYCYKILIAAFIQNPLFFSMAWNWNVFNLDSLAQENAENYYIPMAASSADKGFLHKKIPGIGTMYMYYDEDYEELTLRIELEEENLSKHFKIIQKIQFKETGNIFEIEFKSNGERIIAGKQTPNQNPSHGIRYVGEPLIL